MQKSEFVGRNLFRNKIVYLGKLTVDLTLPISNKRLHMCFFGVKGSKLAMEQPCRKILMDACMKIQFNKTLNQKAAIEI